VWLNSATTLGGSYSALMQVQDYVVKDCAKGVAASTDLRVC